MKSSTWFARVAQAGILAAAVVLLPAVAHAQIGTLAGKVVDNTGKPVVGALVVFENPTQSQHLETKTDKKGEWVQPGMILGGGPGAWSGVVKMEGFEDGKINIVQIRMNSVTDTPTVTLKPAVVRTGGIALKGVDPAKKAASDKLTLEVAKALEASDYDTAISKLNELSTLVDKCSICFTAIGDAYMKKGSNLDAETAYLKSIEFDDKEAAPYEQLANIYNQQRKFDEAAKMSDKAMSIKAAKTGGVSLDAEGEYNAAVISFNASKIPEARTHLEKALQMKPEHAEAHYLFGMVLINQGKIPEAKKELQKYIELAPTGTNVEMAKAIVATP